MEQSLVSIIIPCYNHQKFIKACFESILEQTYSNIELIVIDDCSKDASSQIIREYLPTLEKKLSYVSFQVHEQNMGITKTLNQGLELARGQYIKILASDDMIHPNCIETLVKEMENNSSYDMLFSNGKYIPEGCTYQEAVDNAYQEFYKSNPLPEKEEVVSKLYLNNFIIGGTVFFRRETFEKYGLYDESIGIEDWEYNLRVATKGTIGYVEKSIFFYRQVSTSISHINKKGSYKKRYEYMYQGAIAVLEKYKDCVSEDVYRLKLINICEAYIEKALLVGWKEKVKEFEVKMKNLGVWNYRWQMKCIISGMGLYALFFNMRERLKSER